MSDANLPPERQAVDRGLLATLGLAVVVGLLLFLALRFMHDLQTRAVDGGDWAAAVHEMHLVAAVAASGLTIASVVLGLMLRRLGGSTVDSSRFPPPGSGLTVSEHLDGPAAVERGRLLVKLGMVLLLAGPLLSGLGLWWVFRL